MMAHQRSANRPRSHTSVETAMAPAHRAECVVPRSDVGAEAVVGVFAIAGRGPFTVAAPRGVAVRRLALSLWMQWSIRRACCQ